ncbi:hypothetical protein ACF1CY_002580 [Providencia rettgeri]
MSHSPAKTTSEQILEAGLRIIHTCTHSDHQGYYVIGKNRAVLSDCATVKAYDGGAVSVEYFRPGNIPLVVVNNDDWLKIITHLLNEPPAPSSLGRIPLELVNFLEKLAGQTLSPEARIRARDLAEGECFKTEVLTLTTLFSVWMRDPLLTEFVAPLKQYTLPGEHAKHFWSCCK